MDFYANQYMTESKIDPIRRFDDVPLMPEIYYIFIKNNIIKRQYRINWVTPFKILLFYKNSNIVNSRSGRQSLDP